MKCFSSLLLAIFFGLSFVSPGVASDPAAMSEAPASLSSAAGAAPSCHPDPQKAVDKPAGTAAAPLQTETPKESWPPQVTVPVTEQDAVASDGLHVKTLVFKNILIDRIYTSMRGPWTRKYVTLDPAHSGKYLWMASYRAEILDGQTGEASQEFMCHTNFDLAGAAGTPNAFQHIRSEMSISQGQKEIVFPKGMALRIENIPAEQADINVMVLNNNDAELHKNLDFKVTLRYLDDAAATARKWTPLFQSAASIDCPTHADPSNGTDTMCQPASSFLVESSGGQRTGHWLVPPGRQVITMKLGKGLYLPYDTTAHYIWMHVHPYAESLELRDLTTGTTVWKGKVHNDPKRATILSTDHYASLRGLPVFKDHDYELISTYDNRTGHTVDAMAALWMYFKDRS